MKIGRLPVERWRDYRQLRLEALKNEPTAFGSSFEEEVTLTEDEWNRRARNTLFAQSDGRLVGMIVCYFNERIKKRHVAEIYGFYVRPKYRGEGIGTELLARALTLARRKKGVVKLSLAVNPEQRAAVRMYGKAGFLVVGRTEKELKVGRRFYAMQFMDKML